MRKFGAFLLTIVCLFVVTFSSVFTTNGLSFFVSAKASEGVEVYVGGMSAGFTLGTGGAQVIGLCEVMTEHAVRCPASEVGVRAGDVIVAVNDQKIETMGALNDALNGANGKKVTISVRRGDETLRLEVQPVLDKITNRYKIGVLIRDSVSGIGTVTYIEKDTGKFGALGHSVVTSDQNALSVTGTTVYPCTIVGVTKGVRGKAGELRGMFLTETGFGQAEKLCSCGIFGKIDEKTELSTLKTATATSENAKVGNAYIYSTIDGITPKKYDIEIVKVDKTSKTNKNYVIKIVDEVLLSQTGGIVQGMSGSPILQDGKLIGAVTHVFLNDPTRGYGIDVKQMLEVE